MRPAASRAFSTTDSARAASTDHVTSNHFSGFIDPQKKTDSLQQPGLDKFKWAIIKNKIK